MITGLGIGGAELMLSNLVRRGARYRHSVISLSGNGCIAGDLRAHGVDVVELGMGWNPRAVGGLRRLKQRLASARPALVQTWLYHADLVGGIAARRAGIPVVWNLRQTGVERGGQKLTTGMVARLCASLSRSVPSRIVCASEAAMAAHRAMGFDESRMMVINNGVDTEVFRPDRSARLDIRAELGIPDGTLLIGRVGRYHPQKNYRGFVETAGQIARSLPNVHFVVVGDGVDARNTELLQCIEKRGLGRLFTLMGPRRDVARIMPAFDLVVSSSAFGEGFPNVIAEAMACEIPCVVTDVGDSAAIVGRPEHVVPAGDHRALARSAVDLLHRPPAERRRIGKEGRERVARRYAMDTMTERYEELYDAILGVSGKPAGSRATGSGAC